MAEPQQTLARLAHRAAVEWADDIAFIDSGIPTSFHRAYADAQRLAVALHSLGMRPGDVLSFQLPNWTEAAIINLAASIGGWVCKDLLRQQFRAATSLPPSRNDHEETSTS